MRIAITGHMGSGKSSVTKILRELGYRVFDADEMAKQILESDLVKKDLIKRYGLSILMCDNTIDKAFLASRIFNHQAEKKALEALIHPQVYQAMMLIDHNHDLVFFEVALLFESEGQHHFDQVWLIVCDETITRERLKHTRGFSDEQINERLQHQIHQDIKKPWADRVIDNSQDFEHLKALVESTVNEVKSSYETSA